MQVTYIIVFIVIYVIVYILTVAFIAVICMT